MRFIDDAAKARWDTFPDSPVKQYAARLAGKIEARIIAKCGSLLVDADNWRVRNILIIHLFPDSVAADNEGSVGMSGASASFGDAMLSEMWYYGKTLKADLDASVILDTHTKALQADNARLRKQVNAIVAIAESYECLAQDPAVETSVSQERLGFAQDIYRALGIEMQK